MNTLPDDELAATVAAFKSHKCNITHTAAALKIARSSLGSRLKTAAQRGLMLDFPPAMPGFRVAQVTTDPRGGKHIQQKSEHGDQFVMPEGHTIKGVSALLDANGQEIVKWVKTREDADRALALSAAIHEEFKQYKGHAKLVRPPKETFADLCQYYPIVDPHIGMLAWGPETGESNDLKIGVERVRDGLARLVGQAPAAETAVIINTGDYFHADDQRNATPASGHQLDVDGRNQKVKWAGVNLLRTAIDYALQKHKHVVVKNLKGNHDPESAAWLNISLGLFYANEPRVDINVEDGNNDHFFHLFGVNYTGATHGHAMKPDRMYIMMAEDNPEYWNASLYRWCIFGHIHNETVKEIGSLRCESFRQPVPRDSFAHSHAYRAGSSMQSITLHREGGEIGRHKANFAPSRGLPAR